MNAKELILSKINATAKFVDIYTYMLSLDMSFLDIAKFMQSSIFNKIVGLTETNIFDPCTSKNNFKKALGFYLNVDTLPNVSMKTFKKFLSQQAQSQGIQNYPENPLDLISWTPKNQKEDRLDIDKALEYAWENSHKPSNSHDPNAEEDLTMQHLEDYASMQISMEDGEYEGSVENDAPLNYLDYFEIAKFLENVKLRNEFMKDRGDIKSDEELKLLKNIYDYVIPAMEEMELLGSMLGINQGMKTNDYDMYSYVKRIENFINKRYNEYLIKHKNSETLNEFKLMRFLSDNEYRKQQIEQYEFVKSSYNILDIISRVPHFASMFNTLHIGDYCMNNFSAAYQLERKIADELIKPYKGQKYKTAKLSELEFKEVQKYVNDVFIVNWLREKNIAIKLPVGTKYFNGDKSNMSVVPDDGKVHEVKLNSVYGIASFVYYMDNYAIPTMKADPNLADNSFIQNLNKSVIGDDKHGTKTTFYRLPFNMMQIDSSQNTIKLYETILNDFDKIAGHTFGDWKIGDLFYLYNLIKNKDSFGQNSLTRIFENLIHSKNQTLLVNDYNEQISKWDNDVALRNTISYDIEDIRHRIHERVPGSKISPENIWISMSDWEPSYFTFNMPVFSDTGLSIVSENAERYESRYKGSSSFDPKEAVISVCKRLENNKIPIHMIDDAELEELIKSDPHIADTSVHAFINNGEVYVIVGRAKATDVIHEYIHIIMANMKYNDKNTYYRLMDAIKTHPKFDKYAELYLNSHGSDLQEEVLCKVIQDYLSNLVDTATKNWMDLSIFSNDFATAIAQFLGSDNFYELRTSLQKTKLTIPQVNDIYGKVIDQETNKEVNDIISMGMSSFVDIIDSINYRLLAESEYRDSMYDPELIKLSQKVATIKDKLIQSKNDKNNIKQECN